MAPQLSRTDIAEKIFDRATIQYLERKHQGGTSGKKGTRYEDLVAAAKMAHLASTYIFSQRDDWPAVEEQAYAFVDDIVVYESNQTRHHQCKDSQSVSWATGEAFASECP